MELSSNTIIKSFKTELDPNNVQKTLFLKHAGVKRFTYNWALDLLENEFNKKRLEEKQHLENRKLQNLPDLSKEELKEYRKELN